ncbi:WXG100 family type VII secretion target [uncultured Mycolicibacterium sp.]|uniref:WXG100 family type VII secretion target n=1 Tax=uncultured Mycolicibacterium sp. TaxID=2320817 RepID=UPI00260FA082|nr:WXG100 family type VII secretion target [uncultured Mycolicibacterium sp.]
MALSAEVAALAKEAGNFERIATELKALIGYVENTAASLGMNMSSSGAGTSAQQALQRFHEAAMRQKQQLDEISANIHNAGVQYTTTDDDQAGALASSMNLGF